MGCASSKLDDLPAVALCRDRCGFLDEAIRHRFAISESHVAYIHSLNEIGRSLSHFISQASVDEGGGGGGGGGDSPKLNLPPQKKGDLKEEAHEEDDDDDLHHLHDSPKKGKLPAGSGSGSDSGHLHFNSDSEEEDESDFLHHSDHSSPLHHHLGYGSSTFQPGGGGFGAPTGYVNAGFAPYPNPETMGGQYMGNGYMHMNYMKRTAPPSVIYEQRPMSPQRIYIGESSSSSSSAYYPYNNYPSNNPYPYNGYPNYGAGPGISGGFYGPSSSSALLTTAQTKPPPPPPPPPNSSTWDFMNLFETSDNFYPSYTPSRDSRELREEEGIPDLEDENYQLHEVVKEVHGNQKFAKPPSEDDSDTGEEETSKSSSGDAGGADAEAALYQTRPVENERTEYDVHVVEKKVVSDERKEEEETRRSNATAAARGRPRDLSEVAKEIEAQFARAAASGNEIAKILEVGKLPYNRKHAPTKMLRVVAPSLSVVPSQPSTSNGSEASSSAGPAHLEFDEELASSALRSRKLSSTLHKLYLWEKKLYHEVKAEEKMRVAHDKKVRKLKRLDERGAEAHKVDSTRTAVRSMSTKIRMAVQVVDRISVTINKIRDEELWPQLNELIQGFTQMWKSMLECHQVQCQAIREARGFGPIRSGNKLSEAHLDATRELERELINWTFRFATWVGAQKGFVKSLNSWLLKCLLYEPEETPDGIAPFSPGRIGAPPVFVICNQWSQSLERISENEVLDSMRSFSISLLHVLEQDKLEMRQRVTDVKDLRSLEREDQKIHKEIQALEKQMVLASAGGDGNGLSLSGNVVYQSDTGNNRSLQGSLERIFDAMERFSGESMKAYEDLLQRAVEETSGEEHESDS